MLTGAENHPLALTFACLVERKVAECHFKLELNVV